MRIKIVPVVFVICLCIPLLNMAFRTVPDAPSADFRALAQYPEYGENITDFPAAFQNYFNDNFFSRNALIRLNGTLRYSLLKTSITDRVLVGKDGWLFFTDGQSMENFHGKITLSEDDKQKALDYFLRLKAYLENRGIGFALAIFPDKQTIYPEFLPDHERYTTGNPGLLDQFINYFEARGMDIVDSRAALQREKELSPHPLYLSDDSHWNNYGAAVALKEIVGRLNVLGYAIDIPDYVMNPGTYYSGDLKRMTAALSVPGAYIYDDVAFPAGLAVETYSGWGDLEYRQGSNAPNGLSAVIIGDSFSINMRRIIGATFTKSVILQGSDMSNLESYIAEHDPDILVYTMVERGLLGWPNLVWPENLGE